MVNHRSVIATFAIFLLSEIDNHHSQAVIRYYVT